MICEREVRICVERSFDCVGAGSRVSEAMGISYDLQADRLDLAPFNAFKALYFQEEWVTSKRMKRAG